ncbi:cupin domain-containing protein [Brevibacillus nitrificans]|uniref:cupin domain-containing protein n=1 Tax=Brevibacillus nitrificans TaxID=651560 RepID=UPI00260C54A5|nr:cupin domain-containing protein [Brevibacillus nitrificans]
MTLYLDYKSPSIQYFDDVNRNRLFTKDGQNYINVLSTQTLNSLDNVSLLDIFLSQGNVVEPHYHQNAAELVYCVSGAANVSFINPFTNEVSTYHIMPGQVTNIPQGWWHWEMATADNTHLIAIFNAPIPEVILGSDILRLTPSDVMAHTYCLNEGQWRETVSPIQTSTFIGPPVNCHQGHIQGQMQPQPQVYGYQLPYQQPYQQPQPQMMQPQMMQPQMMQPPYGQTQGMYPSAQGYPQQYW